VVSCVLVCLIWPRLPAVLVIPNEVSNLLLFGSGAADSSLRRNDKPLRVRMRTETAAAIIARYGDRA
jgi:hypothetical protein